MKKSVYEKLVAKANDYQTIYGLSLGSSDFDEKMKSEIKENFENYRRQIDEILTVDMSVFAESIIAFINSFSKNEYDIEKLAIEEDTIYVAKPSNIDVNDGYKLLFECNNAYVLGKNSKKVLSRPTIEVKGVQIPTMSINNIPFSYIYPKLSQVNNEKYLKFEQFMNKWENKAVKEYKKKFTNKR